MNENNNNNNNNSNNNNMNENHYKDGRFYNPWKSFTSKGLLDFLKCRLFNWKKVDLNVNIKVEQPDMKLINNAHSDDKYKDSIICTWIGHATMLLQFEGINVLTDPIFSKRCSAVQWAGPKRLTPITLPIENLPNPIDCVMISHNHYDHLDYNSVVQLNKKGVNKWFVPLGMKEFLINCGVKGEDVCELDWYQEAKYDDKTFVCTPTQHFSSRGLMDRDKALWSSFAIIGNKKRIYFAGDTGYRTVPDNNTSLEDEKKLEFCPAFKNIGNKYGPFDLACIPIGAYSPRYFMSAVHLSPEDAVDVHCDVKSKQSVAMHWGTFCLTDEPLLEPPQRLNKALTKENIDINKFVVIPHGSTKEFKASTDE